MTVSDPLDPTLRRYRADDAEALAALWHDAWHDGHGAIFPPEIVAMRTPATFAERLKPLAAGVLVAESAAGIVGFAAVEGEEVDQLYVAATARGTGLAARLLAAAEAELRARGVVDAVIQCTAGNARAHRFYSRHGWRDDGIANLPIWMPDTRTHMHPTHVFRKRLSPPDKLSP